jgi:hypothetical protein
VNIEELKSARATAGAAYAAAVTQFHDALIELAAIDQLLSATTGGSSTFGPLPDPVQFRHPEFASNVSGHWQTDVANRVEQINLAGTL